MIPPIRSESLPWLIGTGLPTLVLYGVWIWTGSWWAVAGFVPLTALFVFLVYFFRDPDRTPDTDRVQGDDDCWLAPADGIVTRIDEEEGRYRLVIFLTVFNVHVNRMPVDGTVKGIYYQEGQFLPAFADNLDQRNERNRIICEDRHSRSFEVWQIAGMLARRIHFWKDVDDSFQRGERFGMIALGSRTDLVLPPDVEPVVQREETVRGGETVVARG